MTTKLRIFNIAIILALLIISHPVISQARKTAVLDSNQLNTVITPTTAALPMISTSPFSGRMAPWD